jgi:hypothetical protein
MGREILSSFSEVEARAEGIVFSATDVEDISTLLDILPKKVVVPSWGGEKRDALVVVRKEMRVLVVVMSFFRSF